MSGPKGIHYEIAQERRRVEDALQRWRVLNGQAQSLSLRCAAVDITDVRVVTGAAPIGTSAAIEAACIALQHSLTSAENTLESLLAEQRSQRITHSLGAVLDELDERESAIEAAATAVQDRLFLPSKATSNSEIKDRVRRVLSSLIDHSGELETAAEAVLRAQPDRARLLLSDLSSRVNSANRLSRRRIDHRRQIEEMRAEAASLADRSRIDVLLDGAANALESSVDPTPSLDAARTSLTRQYELEREARDQAFVLEAVTESLVSLGYSVSPIDLETSDSVVLTRSGKDTHAVTAEVSGGEIGLRTVRTTAATNAAADLAAEQQMCSDLDPLLEALRIRGVASGRVRAVPAGVTTPKLLASSTTTQASAKTDVGARRKRETERVRE